MRDLRVLIVDDEPLVRRGLRRVLAAMPEITVVGEARHGKEALLLVDRHGPDLVFLDVKMPELDGLGVVRALATRPAWPRPGVVFVTAFDRYAVEAFEHHAIDYLLKPFDDERVRRAVARARERLSADDERAAGRRVEVLLDELAQRGRRRDRLAVRTGSRTVLVEVRDVDWVEAADNYVRLHVGGAVHVLRETLRQIEQELDPSDFLRIHRSTIVNLSRVAELRPQPGGDQTVVLTDGTRLTLSRRFREAFERRVGRAG